MTSILLPLLVGLLAPNAYAQQFAGTTINNTLPNVPNAEITYWNIPDVNNKATTLINYSSLNTTGKRLVPSAVQRVVIFMHGDNRDPFNYMNYMLSALSAVPGQPQINRNSVQLVAPYFPNGDDKAGGTTQQTLGYYAYPWNVSAPAGYGSYTNVLAWSGSGWMNGTFNQYPITKRSVSSYTVLDDMITYFDNKTLYPNLQQIVLGGHSAGAQTVQRYTAVNNKLGTKTPVSYYIANPDSYVWMSTDRPFDTTSCPSYDYWRMGLSQYTNTYGASLVASGRPAVLSNYYSHSIHYARGTDDDGDDSSTCGAYTEGNNRNERFANFITSFPPPTCSNGVACNTVDYVPVGHDAGAMMASTAGIDRLFTDNWSGNGSMAYDYGCPRLYTGDDPYADPTCGVMKTPTNAGTYDDGFGYSGCYSDSEYPSNTLPYTAYTGWSNATINTCVDACSAAGYSLAGAESGNDCFCGNSMFWQTNGPLTEASCSVNCTGNSSQICGDLDRISIFSLNGATPVKNPQPSSPATVGTFSYEGCYNEISGRALPGASSFTNSMTVETCVGFCNSKGYDIAGLEYYSQCFCGNQLSAGSNKTTDNYCNFPCAGNQTELCGGNGYLNVYAINSTFGLPYNGSTITSSSSLAASTVSTSTSTSATSATTYPAATGALSCPQSDQETFTTNGDVFVVECFVDRAGGDINGAVPFVMTLEACIAACATTAGCVDLSWLPGSDPNGSPCYMKSQIDPAGSNSAVWGARFIGNSNSTFVYGSTTSTTSTASSTSTQLSSTSVLLSSTTSTTEAPFTNTTSLSSSTVVLTTSSIFTNSSASSLISTQPTFATSSIRSSDSTTSLTSSSTSTPATLADSTSTSADSSTSVPESSSLVSSTTSDNAVTTSVSSQTSSSTQLAVTTTSSSVPATSSTTSSTISSIQSTPVPVIPSPPAPTTTSTTSSTSATPTPTTIQCPTANSTTHTVNLSTFEIECAMDRNGPVLSVQYVNSLDDCIAWCANTTSCVDVSWVAAPNAPCYLKDAIGDVLVNTNVWGARLVAVSGKAVPSMTSTTSSSSAVAVVATSSSSVRASSSAVTTSSVRSSSSSSVVSSVPVQSPTTAVVSTPSSAPAQPASSSSSSVAVISHATPASSSSTTTAETIASTPFSTSHSTSSTLISLTSTSHSTSSTLISLTSTSHSTSSTLTSLTSTASSSAAAPPASSLSSSSSPSSTHSAAPVSTSASSTSAPSTPTVAPAPSSSTSLSKPVSPPASSSSSTTIVVAPIPTNTIVSTKLSTVSTSSSSSFSRSSSTASVVVPIPVTSKSVQTSKSTSTQSQASKSTSSKSAETSVAVSSSHSSSSSASSSSHAVASSSKSVSSSSTSKSSSSVSKSSVSASTKSTSAKAQTTKTVPVSASASSTSKVTSSSSSSSSSSKPTSSSSTSKTLKAGKVTSTQGAVAETSPSLSLSRTLTTSTKSKADTTKSTSVGTKTGTGTHAIAAASTSAVASPTCTPNTCLKAFETHPKSAEKVCGQYAEGAEKVEFVSVLAKACGVKTGDDKGWMDKVGDVCPCLTS